MADRHMTLVEHLDELRYRILISLAAIAIGTSIAFWKIKPIVAYLAKPVGHLVFLSPTEAFMAYFKLAFFVGLFLASPVILFQIWGFVSSALKEKEQKILRNSISSEPGLIYHQKEYLYLLLNRAALMRCIYMM